MAATADDQHPSIGVCDVDTRSSPPTVAEMSALHNRQRSPSCGNVMCCDSPEPVTQVTGHGVAEYARIHADPRNDVSSTSVRELWLLPKNR